MALQKSFVFNEEENKMIELKYSSKKIGAMNPNELKIWVEVFLLKISVITGWVLPSNEVVMTVLKDQFEKKLLEDYPSLNNEEVEYAFRHSDIQDWGKELNLNMIDQVLWPYELKRRRLSEEEERMQPPPEKKPYNPEEILNQYRFEVETAFQAIRKGYKPIIHIYFAETLIQDGLMQEGANINEFLVSVVNNPEVKNLYTRD
jgi:hypothetical protein